MTTQKSLSELYKFTSSTPILDNLDRLIGALDLRLGALDKIGQEEQIVLDSIVQIALVRMNEVFTPLILAAQARLEQFGAAFAAESDTSLTVGTGVKILVLTEETREAWIIADYVGLTSTDGEATMLGHVDDYDRETGQLFITVVGIGGSGTHEGWHVRMSAAPDLAHAGRTDNPHSTTAAQVGTYTTAQVDSALDSIFDSAKAYVDGLGFMRQNQNLNDLIDKNAARVNLNAQVALGFAPLNKAGDTATGAIKSPQLWSTGGTFYLSTDGSKYLQWTGTYYQTHLGRLMQAASNLSELTNPTAARTALGLGSAATVSSSSFLGTQNNLGDVPSKIAARLNLAVVGEGQGPNQVGVGRISLGWYDPQTVCHISADGSDQGHLLTFSQGVLRVSWDGQLRFTLDGNTVKTFVIEHPSPGKDDRHLVHACVEAPEAIAGPYRGRGEVGYGGFVEVELPDYFEDLCDASSATITLQRIRDETPGMVHFPTQSLEVGEIRGNRFAVYGATGCKFHWRVEARRKDVAQFSVEPLKSNVVIRGDGPYTYVHMTKRGT